MKPSPAALAAAILLGGCAPSQQSVGVAVDSGGDVAGGVAVESVSPRNSNVSTAVAVGTGGAGVAVGTGNVTVGVRGGARRGGGVGLWF